MKKALGLLVLLLMAAAAWIYVAPRLAATQLRTAAASGDVNTLNQLVDFEQVRANMKADLRARLKERPYGTLVAAGTGSTLDALVDRIMTARGLVNLARLGPTQRLINMGYQSVTAFFVKMQNPARPSDAVTYVFGPAGLTWELQRIDVPNLVSLAREMAP